ncbi:MAG: hypothetical protein ABIS37_06990 [Bacteroidia bacterium]
MYRGKSIKYFYLIIQRRLGLRDLSATKHSKYRVQIIDDLNQPVFNASILQDGTTNKVETGINGMAPLFIKPVAKGQLLFTALLSNREIKKLRLKISRLKRAKQFRLNSN